MKSLQEKKRTQWREVINGWRASELGVREFCRQHGEDERRFYYWRRRLTRSYGVAGVKLTGYGQQPAIKFLPVQVKDVPVMASPGNNMGASSRIEVFFGNGALIRISGELSDDNVAGIMKLAAGASC